jgi:ArsR family transcriptional regulator, arsenate/arsenite/antimonite-responsive transcriptional repressor
MASEAAQPSAITPAPSTELNDDDAVSLLVALGHRLRINIWRHLLRCGEPGMTAGAIAARFATPPSSLSFHLQQLTRAGALRQRHNGRQIIYSAQPHLVDALCRFFTDTLDDIEFEDSGTIQSLSKLSIVEEK